MSQGTPNSKKKSIWLEPDPKPILKDPSLIKKKYSLLQPTIFVLLYLMYFSSYLGRKQLTVGFFGPTGKGHSQFGIEDLFHLDPSVYAIMGIIYYSAYGVGKFLGGVMADKANVKIALPISLGVSAILPLGIVWGCESFGLTSKGTAITIMYISWGLAAFIQAASFPMCGKMLTFWFSNKNRPTIWSWWSTSHELGSACSMGLAVVLISNFDYKAVFFVPAFIGLSIAIVAIFLLKDKPVTIGLPNVETYVGTAITKDTTEEITDTRPYSQVFKEEVLKNKTIWLLSISFICLYIVRTGPTDWFQKMFQNDSLGQWRAVVVPACGCIGTLTIPWVSKICFKNRRAPALFVYFLVATLCFTTLALVSTPKNGGQAIWNLPSSISTPLQFILCALIGISTYGPLVMIGGVASIESASKRVAAATTGFTGAMGYVGSILMSAFGGIFANHGNGYMFAIWIIACIVAMLVLLAMWNQKANKEYSH